MRKFLEEVNFNLDLRKCMELMWVINLNVKEINKIKLPSKRA